MSLRDKLRATVAKRKDEVRAIATQQVTGISMEEMQAAVLAFNAHPELIQQLGAGWMAGTLTPREAAALIDQASPTVRDIIRRLGGFEFVEYALRDQYAKYRGGLAVFFDGVLAAPPAEPKGEVIQ